MEARGRAVAVVAVALAFAACTPPPQVPEASAPTPSATATTPAPVATSAPAWLGTRVLAAGPTGFAPPQPTPPELYPRSIATRDRLPPPTGDAFAWTVAAVPDEVAARSTWHDGCPVTLDDLRLVTVGFHGFDGAAHTGELLVNADATDALESIFRAMWETDFPLEEVRITSPADMGAPPTGDGNTTSAFVCRDARGSTSWSEHAYGRAVDIDPFQNPYVREADDGRVVLPELATAYTDRSLDLPGMLHDGDPVVAAIRAAGWTWGGDYTTLKDTMHASATGR